MFVYDRINDEASFTLINHVRFNKRHIGDCRIIRKKNIFFTRVQVLADGALASLAISGSDNHLWAAFGVGFAVAFGIWTALGVSGK